MFVLEHVYGTCLWNIFHEHFLPMSPPPSVSLELQNDAKRCKTMQIAATNVVQEKNTDGRKNKIQTKMVSRLLFPHNVCS
jgi:hypothetical protein